MPSFLHPLAYLRLPGNAISFFIRNTLRWSRGKPKLIQEKKEKLFAYLISADEKKAQLQEVELLKRYHLTSLQQYSTKQLYRKSLYLLDVLDKATESITAPKEKVLQCLDVGSQDWHYVFALHQWMSYWGTTVARNISLTGIEIDGYGIYSDLRSRYDYAQAYVEQVTKGNNPNVTYRVQDFLKSPDREMDIITFFYPFVLRVGLLLWGLPNRFFKPQNFIAHAAQMLKSGGYLICFNHTYDEAKRFRELCAELSVWEQVSAGSAQSNLVDYYCDVEDRHFTVMRKF